MRTTSFYRAAFGQGRHTSAIALIAASIVLPGAAAAQSIEAPVPAAPTAEDETEQATPSGEIVVTGSLIARRDATSSSPISTVDASALASTASPSLDRALGQLPQFSGAQGAAEVGDSQGTIGFSGGQSYSDLRGLGPNRSLVLLDGRRLMASSPDGAIDLNTIPSSLIGSVEVITGGASATYGSDAVAGVVNFKLRTKLDGLELTAKTSITDEGDGATKSVAAAWGSSFADSKGRVLFALEYADRDAVAGRDRPFFANIRQLARPPEGIIGAGNYGGGAPTIAAVNAVLAGYPGTTPIAGSGAYPGAIGVNNDGTIFTTLAGSNCVQNYRGLNQGVLGLNISPNCRQVQVALGQYFAVQVPLKRYNAFTKLSYELSDDINVYGQFGYMRSEALSQTGAGSSKPAVPLIVTRSNPFITGNPALQQILNSNPAGTGNLIVTKLLTNFGNRVETFDYDVWQGVVGLEGRIPGTALSFNLYGSHGKAQYVNTMYGDVSSAAINSALNGTANYKGQAGNCVGYAVNPFGSAPISAGCLEYISRTNINTNDQKQTIIEGTVQGPLISLPAGDLSFAVGADHRQTSFKYVPADTLRTNDSISYGLISAASGKQSVNEVFGELLIPILKDTPFSRELTVNLGARYSDYSLFGGQSTYKGDVTWRPVEPVLLRGSYSVAIRAPSLGNLFGPTSVAQLPIGTGPNAGDPCAVGSIYRTGSAASQVQALCQAQGIPSAIYPTYTYGISTVPGLDGSNPSLTPERATTYSFGTVITPRFNSPVFNRVQFSVDYYNIRIKDAIGALLLSDILPRCFNSDGTSNPSFDVGNAYCQRITRDPLTGQITLGRQGLFNFATYTVAGIDAQLNWQMALGDMGIGAKDSTLNLRSTVSYLDKYTVAGLLGSPTYNYAGTAGFGGVGGGISHPRWKTNTSLTYETGPFSGTLIWRHISKMIHSDLLSNPASPTPGVGAYNYFDANAEFTAGDRFTFGLGVTNLTDKTPPFISAAPLTTDAATYDVIGRTFFASIKAKF